MIPVNISSTHFDFSPTVQTEINRVNIIRVPFYSQFKDIQALSWKKNGCGIASLAMIMEFYKPGVVSLDNLLKQAVTEGAYLQNVGWIHKELVLVSEKYGFEGKTYDFFDTNKDVALNKLQEVVKDNPVIVSIYNKFDPNSSISHLIVINSINGETIYYNDPSEQMTNTISISNFLSGWKRRFIVIKPVNEKKVAMLSQKTDILSSRLIN